MDRKQTEEDRDGGHSPTDPLLGQDVWYSKWITFPEKYFTLHLPLFFFFSISL